MLTHSVPAHESRVLSELNMEARRYNCTDDPTDLYSKANKLLLQEYGAWADNRTGRQKRIRELVDQLIIQPHFQDGSKDTQALALRRILLKLLTCPQAAHRSMGMQLLTSICKLRGSTDVAFTGRDLRALLDKYKTWLHGQSINIRIDSDGYTESLPSYAVLMVMRVLPQLGVSLMPHAESE